jgi:UDPglucose 6-dehydrogenase
MREAASIDIISMLVRKGAEVRAYDPVAMKNAKRMLPGAVEFFPDPYTTCNEADAILLLTEWNEFKQIDFDRVKKLMRQRYFFDGRNLYDPQEMDSNGFIYRGVGRPH